MLQIGSTVQQTIKTLLARLGYEHIELHMQLSDQPSSHPTQTSMTATFDLITVQTLTSVTTYHDSQTTYHRTTKPSNLAILEPTLQASVKLQSTSTLHQV